MSEGEHLVWNVCPEIFEWGPLAPRWYGLLFAAGFLLGFMFMERVFRHESRPVEDLSILLLYLLGGTVIGARLGHVLFYHPGYYLLHPGEIIQIWEGGLASHGGAIGVPVAVWLYAKNRPEQPFLWLLDRLSIPTALTGAFIRLGNFFNSEILGRPAEVSWAVVFSRVDQVPRHPVQLYESAAYLSIFIGLWGLYRAYGASLNRGVLFGLFLVGVFSSRIALEMFKAPQASFANILGPLSMGQWLSLPLVGLGLWLLFRSNPSGQARLAGA